MLFEVLRGGSNEGGAGPEKAAYMQTPAEHAQMLEPDYWPELKAEYDAAMAMPPGPVKYATLNYLKSKAEALEAKYPSYWYDGNTERPKRTQSSSWVTNIRYEPRSKEMYITLPNKKEGNKTYTYVNVTPDQMGRLLTSQSIGRILNESKSLGTPGNGGINYHGISV